MENTVQSIGKKENTSKYQKSPGLPGTLEIHPGTFPSNTENNTLFSDHEPKRNMQVTFISGEPKSQ